MDLLNFAKLKYKGKDIAVGAESIKTVTAEYALIDFGDGARCAWCYKWASKIKDLDKHLKNHEKAEKKLTNN